MLFLVSRGLLNTTQSLTSIKKISRDFCVFFLNLPGRFVCESKFIKFNLKRYKSNYEWRKDTEDSYARETFLSKTLNVKTQHAMLSIKKIKVTLIHSLMRHGVVKNRQRQRKRENYEGSIKLHDDEMEMRRKKKEMS